MQKLVKIWQVGNICYTKGLTLQNHLANIHKQNKNNLANNTLLIVEHPPVYTTGIRTKDYSETEENRLKQTAISYYLGAEFHRTNRGGLITFHGPGQLVVYPVLNLKNFKSSMRWYVSQIEQTVIDLCKKFGIEAETSPHTGVWIGDNKVCAIGIHGSCFITTHGLALNCCNDLKWFEHIVPCGIEGKGVTSLSKELNRHISINEVIPAFIDSFSKVFECNYINFSEEEAERILSTV